MIHPSDEPKPNNDELFDFRKADAFKQLARLWKRRIRKRNNQRRYRQNPVHRERERKYWRQYNRQKPRAIAHRWQKMLRRFERQEARIKYQQKVEKWKRKRLERKWSRLIHPREKRLDKPAELKGLNALDYSHMTLEQRKAWNKWTHEIYAERYAERQRRWRRQNLEKHRAQRRKDVRVWRSNPKNRILLNAFRRIKDLCPRIKIESPGTLRGCSAQFFWKHIEEQFYGGMTWENYGEDWELDHVRPVCRFDLTIAAERLACANFMNLQPLLIKDNQEKRDRDQPNMFIDTKDNEPTLFDMDMVA